jgi:hypothetical protein
MAANGDEGDGGEPCRGLLVLELMGRAMTSEAAPGFLVLRASFRRAAAIGPLLGGEDDTRGEDGDDPGSPDRLLLVGEERMTESEDCDWAAVTVGSADIEACSLGLLASSSSSSSTFCDETERCLLAPRSSFLGEMGSASTELAFLNPAATGFKVGCSTSSSSVG